MSSIFNHGNSLWVAIMMSLAATSFCVASSDDGGLQRFEFTGVEMATPVRIVLYASDQAVASKASSAALTRIRELNFVFSDYDPRSELNRLCRDEFGNEGIEISSDLRNVLAYAWEVSEVSNGAFDVTVGPAVRLWRQARKQHSLPASQELKNALSLVNYRHIKLDPESGKLQLLKQGLQLDLGGIAKGYAADEALRILSEHGLNRALVDIGGDMALGAPPPGTPGWRIGVATHDAKRQSMDHLWLSRAGVATSGDLEQYVVIDGQRYSHLVDPRTGVGLTDQGLVTVIAPDCMTADAMASAVSVLDAGKGLQMIDRTPGAAGRIVRQGDEGRACYESKIWSGLDWVKETDTAVLQIAKVDTAEKSKGASRADAGSEPAGQEAGEEGSAGKIDFDPTTTLTVGWMLDPVPLPESTANDEKAMKPYTETIPGAGVKFDMVPVAGGTFLMGSPPDEADRSESEGPQFKVELDPFWMGKCEVTWDEYELWGLGFDAQRQKQEKEELTARDRLADAITRPTKPYADMTFGMGRKGYPALCMTHLSAKVYCKWLSAKTGRYYRLPTEAEWEYACRAGTKTAYHFGDDPKDLGNYAWYAENNEDKYHLVGQKKPNAWGLHDMHGNVAEWVLDQLSEDGYGKQENQPVRNPLNIPNEIYPRVVRGGSWMDDPEMLRSAARQGSSEDWKLLDPQMPQSVWYHTDAYFVGFRVVRPLKVPSKKEAEQYDLDPVQKEEMVDYLEYQQNRD